MTTVNPTARNALPPLLWFEKLATSFKGPHHNESTEYAEWFALACQSTYKSMSTHPVLKLSNNRLLGIIAIHFTCYLRRDYDYDIFIPKIVPSAISNIIGQEISAYAYDAFFTRFRKWEYEKKFLAQMKDYAKTMGDGNVGKSYPAIWRAWKILADPLTTPYTNDPDFVYGVPVNALFGALLHMTRIKLFGERNVGWCDIFKKLNLTSYGHGVALKMIDGPELKKIFRWGGKILAGLEKYKVESATATAKKRKSDDSTTPTIVKKARVETPPSSARGPVPTRPNGTARHLGSLMTPPSEKVVDSRKKTQAKRKLTKIFKS